MMLWLVTRIDGAGYGETNGIVCAALSEEDARGMFPGGVSGDSLEAKLVAHGSTSYDPEIILESINAG